MNYQELQSQSAENGYVQSSDSEDDSSKVKRGKAPNCLQPVKHNLHEKIITKFFKKIVKKIKKWQKHTKVYDLKNQNNGNEQEQIQINIKISLKKNKNEDSLKQVNLQSSSNNLSHNRQRYKTDSQIDCEGGLYCICEIDLLQCETCGEWYHFDCLGFIGNECDLMKIEFMCMKCLQFSPNEIKLEKLKQYSGLFRQNSIIYNYVSHDYGYSHKK